LESKICHVIKNLSRNIKTSFFCILISLNAVGQKFDFRNFTTSEGLNSGAVLSLFQDSDNRLWIGSTEGLNVFDGIEFESLNDEVNLPKKVVYSINRINAEYFIGTAGGLVVYNRDTSRIFHSSENGVSDYVYCSYQDKKGTIWVGTENGLMVFKDGLSDTTITDELIDVPIYNIEEDSNGSIWLCTKTKGLFKVSGDEVKQYKFGEMGPYFVGDVLEVSNNEYWVAARSGLYKIADNEVSEIETGLTKNSSYYDLLKSSDNEIIVASDEGFLLYKENAFKVFNETNGLLNNRILKIFQDNTQTLWFASPYGGVSQLVTKKMEMFDKDFIEHEGVNAIIRKNQDEYYLPTPKGVGLFNKTKNSYKIVYEKLHMEFMNGVYDQENQRLLLGTNNGILVIDDKEKAPASFIRGSAAVRKVFDISIDEKGVVWTVTSGGVAKVVEDRLVYIESNQNINNYGLSLCIASNGVIYFGTDEGLIIHKDSLLNYSKKENFNPGRIRQIVEDKSGLIWLTADEGLFKEGDEGFEIVPIRMIQDETIESFSFDSKGKLWLGLSKGIAKVTFNDNDTSVRWFKNLGEYTGIETSMAAILEVDQSEMWFGTSDGLLKLNADFSNEIISSSEPSINISAYGLKDLDSYKVLNNHDEEAYELPYGLNQIEISTKIVNLLVAREIEFEYRLKGVDKEWKTRENNFSVVYTELPFGDFEFQVKVKPHPNLVNTDKIHTIKISIAKPFYFQTWFILICLAILLTWIYSYIIIKRNVGLLNKQKSIILDQKSLVEEKNKEIVDSITYAKRIQNAIIPPDAKMDKLFKEYFVFYQPRDIVSGDFYWVEQIEGWVVFAAADCTGHGVPGAMVSLMCNNLLNKVVIERKELDPGMVLDIVTALLLQKLQETDDKVQDGMDIALCFWNNETNELLYSGANNPLYLIRNEELKVIKATKQPVGYFEEKVPFETHKIQLEKGDQIVLFSDGYKDQFGGPKNKKFGTKQFNNTLVENSNLPMHEQKKILIDKLADWKGQDEAVDDVCVFSVRV
jgi:ligand-binding sensor domain-containing protein/serine phosphatase RsbU (regulator of sigma subunit)